MTNVKCQVFLQIFRKVSSIINTLELRCFDLKSLNLDDLGMFPKILYNIRVAVDLEQPLQLIIVPELSLAPFNRVWREFRRT